MFIVDMVRESLEGLRLGARYSVSTSHNLTEKAVQPRIIKIGNENFGR